MEVQNSMAKSIAQERRDYDETCKRILAERQIRARILHDYVSEFSNTNIAAIESMLDDEVEVGTEPIGRDDWAAYSVGGHERNTEDSTLAEGVARFDVRFSVPIPGKGSRMTIEVDLEAQNKWDVGYPLASRAVFYCARMLSMQGDKILPKSEYEKLNKVYSVWVCSHPDKEHKGVVEQFSMRPHSDRESLMFDGYDLMDVCFICLDSHKISAEDGCLGLLGALFALRCDPKELRRILADDFGMIMTESIDERVEAMCNFSEGIWEDGKAEGRAEGRAEALRSLMASLSIGIERAMELLCIPSSERERYEQMIANDSRS